MLEVLLVVGLVGAAVVAAVVPWPSLLAAGVWMTAAGLAFGVATGLWYHVALGRALAVARARAPRWWLRPAAFHGRLDTAARRGVLPWFYAGAVGFVVTVAGLGLVVLGVAAGAWRTP